MICFAFLLSLLEALSSSQALAYMEKLHNVLFWRILLSNPWKSVAIKLLYERKYYKRGWRVCADQPTRVLNWDCFCSVTVAVSDPGEWLLLIGRPNEVKSMRHRTAPVVADFREHAVRLGSVCNLTSIIDPTIMPWRDLVSQIATLHFFHSIEQYEISMTVLKICYPVRYDPVYVDPPSTLSHFVAQVAQQRALGTS